MAAAIVLLAVPAAGETSNGGTLDLEAPVSTSPVTAKASARLKHRHQPPSRTEQPPLTRAAARRQVEAISPLDWLASFGHVEFERRR